MAKKEETPVVTTWIGEPHDHDVVEPIVEPVVEETPSE